MQVAGQHPHLYQVSLVQIGCVAHATQSEIYAGSSRHRLYRENADKRLRLFGHRREAILQRYITFIFICTFFLIRKLGFNVTSISTLLLYGLQPIKELFPRARNS